MRYFEPKLAQHMGCMLNEYLYYFYYREKALQNIQKTGETRGERIKRINDCMLQELGRYDADVSDFLPAEIIPDFKARMMEQI